MFLHKTLSQSSLRKTGNTVFTLPWRLLKYCFDVTTGSGLESRKQLQAVLSNEYFKTLPWESRALRPGEGPPRPPIASANCVRQLRPALPAARKSEVVSKRHAKGFVHECL